MEFRFANLMGAPYRGGNLLIVGSELLSPVGNRVSQVQAPVDTVVYVRRRSEMPVVAGVKRLDESLVRAD